MRKLPTTRKTQRAHAVRKPARNEVALRLLANQEDERRRIARMLHDDLGQTLTAAVLDLEYVKQSGEAKELIEATLKELRRLLADARDLSLSLRPALIDEEGLEAALGALCSRLRSLRGCDVVLRCRLLKTPLPMVVALVAYRIVQEAAAPIAGVGRRVSVALRQTRVALTLVVEADAGGFGAAADGALSADDRARILGGRATFGTDHAGRQRLVAELPL